MKATATTTRATMDPPTTFNLTMAAAANGMAAIRFGEEAEEVLADAAGEEEVETEVADGTIADAAEEETEEVFEAEAGEAAMEEAQGGASVQTLICARDVTIAVT